jgi:hypothetical protein
MMTQISNRNRGAMNKIELGLSISPNKLKHLKLEVIKNEFVATLMDSSGYEIIKGYGSTVEEAISDMHFNII